MRIYLAGTIYNGIYLGSTDERCTPIQRQHVREAGNYLESYHYFNTEKICAKVRGEGIRVFLDSGAFSAYTKGISVDIEEYCRFCRENSDIIEVASVLDAVGDPLKTWQNQQQMEALGVPALPCFHYGEDERYLEHYVSKYEYITLGGMVPISNRDLFKWLDHLWEKYLCDPSGRARLRVHGFGMTSVPLMKRYPWYSVDSSSWVQIGSVGSIMHPDYGVIAISSSNPNRKQEGRHFDTMSHLEQTQLAHEFQKIGYTVEELRTNYRARWAFCVWAYTEMNRRINTHGLIFEKEQQGLF